MTDAKRSEWKFLMPPDRGAMLCYWGQHEVYFADDSPQLSAEQLNVTCDALNVHETTGLTPSQLQARVAELEAALRTAYELGTDSANIAYESPLWAHLAQSWERLNA